MEGKIVTVELKNNLLLRGILVAVDQYLNIKLENVEVVEKNKYPQLVMYHMNCAMFYYSVIAYDPFSILFIIHTNMCLFYCMS